MILRSAYSQPIGATQNHVERERHVLTRAAGGKMGPDHLPGGFDKEVTLLRVQKRLLKPIRKNGDISVVFGQRMTWRLLKERVRK